MSKTLSASEYYEILRRIENASSSSELRAIKEILEEYDADDPKVKELVYKLRWRNLDDEGWAAKIDPSFI